MVRNLGSKSGRSHFRHQARKLTTLPFNILRVFFASDILCDDYSSFWEVIPCLLVNSYGHYEEPNGARTVGSR